MSHQKQGNLRIMGRKEGMMQMFDETGKVVVCTIISAEPNVVVQVKNQEKDGYNAIQLGTGLVSEKKAKNISKPLRGHFKNAKVEPRKHLAETLVAADAGFEVGQEISVDHFAEAKMVDVCAISKGKGFQGVIKRHNFGGGPASHGSGFHRAGGSTGMCSSPGRGLPGVKMPGRMGGERKTVENLRVIKVDAEKNILVVKGSIPGPNQGLVVVRKAIKRG